MGKDASGTIINTSAYVGRLLESIPASYTVFKIGSTYYAECNGASGTDYSGTGAAAVIQNAIDVGGIVFLKAGTYDLNSINLNIAEKNYVHLIGEGIDKTILQNGGISKNHATPTYGCEIRDLTIDVNNVVTKGINLAINSYDFQLKNIKVMDANSNFLVYWDAVDKLLVEGCYFYDGGLSVAADNCAGDQLTTTNNTTIWRNNWFVKENSDGGGMLTTGATGNLLIEGNSFVDLSDTSYGAVSIENTFGVCKSIICNNNYAYAIGFSIGNNTTNQINYAQLCNNIVEGNGPAGAGHGGLNIYKAKHGIIANNEIHNTEYGILTSTCDLAEISNNIIHNTNIKDSGTAGDKAAMWCNANTITKIIGNIAYDDAGLMPHGFRAGGGRIYIENNAFRGPFTSSALWFSVATDYLKLLGNDVNGAVTWGTITTAIIDKNTDYTIEHHTASDTLTTIESGTVHTNLGAGGAIKLTLPQDAFQGTTFDFAVMTAQQLQIDPGAAGAIYIDGAQQADDAYIWADAIAETVRLVADGNGDWIAISPVGTWTVV